MLDGIDTAHATDNLWGERWTKLCVNGMRNGVSAATGLGGNARDSHDAIRRVCIRLGGESVRVGQALGFTLGKIGALDPEKLALASEGDRDALEEIEALMLAGTNAAARSDLQRPSMAQDMAKGRRTEIEFMNGFIAEKGAEVGVPAPTHAMLTEVVKRVERGETRRRSGERAGKPLTSDGPLPLREGASAQRGQWPASTGERHLGRTQPLEADAADVARLQIAQAGAGAAGDELAGAHAALLAHHVHQHHRNTEWIAGRMPSHLLQHRRAVHRQRHLQLAEFQAAPRAERCGMHERTVADAVRQLFQVRRGI